MPMPRCGHSRERGNLEIGHCFMGVWSDLVFVNGPAIQPEGR